MDAEAASDPDAAIDPDATAEAVLEAMAADGAGATGTDDVDMGDAEAANDEDGTQA